VFARLGFVAPPPAPAEGGAAIAFVRAASLGTPGGEVITINLPSVDVGHVLVLGVSLYEYDGDGIPESVVSIPALTWTLRATSPDADPYEASTRATIWTSSAVASAGTHAITMQGAVNAYAHATAAEFHGIDAASPLDAASAGLASTSTAPSTGSATATGTGRLALACYAQSSSNSGGEGTGNGLDLPTGYTNLGIQRFHDLTLGHSFDYRILASAGATSAAWGTLNSAESWGAVLALLKPAP
jgi:hypothetical protein